MAITRIEPYIVNSNANFTFGGANITGNLSVSNISNLGANGNVKITGGSANQVLSTDGAGNLSWITVTGGGGNGISNGTSNINIPNANGNINFTAAGNANVFVVRGTGILANGQVTFTDPLVEQGGLANGDPLGSDDGKDRGTILNYYDTFAAQAFMGWKNANNEFVMASEVTVANDLVTVYTLGNVRAGTFIGNVQGNISGNLQAPGSNTQVLFNDANTANASAGFTFDKTTNALSVAGQLNANTANITGTANAGNFYTLGNLSVSGNSNLGEIFATGGVNAVGNVSGNNFAAAGNISAVGNISGGNLATSGNANITGDMRAGNANVAGNLSVVANSQFTGNSQFGNAVIVDQRLSVGNPNSVPKVDMFSNGYVRMFQLDVDTQGANNDTGKISARLVDATTGNFSTLNISNGILVTNTITTGSLSTNANITAGNANLGNLAKANFFQGDGFLLTNLTIPAGSAIENGNSNVAVAPNANVTFSVSGNANVVTVTGSELRSNVPVNVAANISATNVSVSSNLTVNGIVFTGSIKDGQSTLTLDGTSEFVRLGVNASSNLFYANANGIWLNDNTNVSQNLTVTGNTFVQKITANGNIVSNANIQALNANLGNLVTANFFSGDGYLLTNLTIGAGSAIVNGNSNVVVAPNANVGISVNGVVNVVTFTSSETVFSTNANATTWLLANALKVTGTANFVDGLVASNSSKITARYIDVGNGTYPGYLDVDGNVNFQNRLTVSGTANFSGSFNVNQTIRGNANLQVDDYVVANYAAIAFRANVPNLNVSNIANITNLVANSVTVNSNISVGNANLGNLATANFFQGDGYLLTNLTITAGSSITNGNSNVVVIANGNVNISSAGNANVVTVTGTGMNVAGTGNFTGNLAAGNLSATDANFASANITGNIGAGNINAGIGNFSGNITAANANLGNLVAANFFSGDGSLLTNLTISAGNALLNGSSNVYVEFSGPIRFKSNNTANVLVVSNTGIQTGNITGSGTLNVASYANGTSNIIVRTDGDITISSNGVSNVLLVSNVGANVTGLLRAIGNLNVTGNANIGNLGVSGNISAGGEVSGGSLDTGGNLRVGGNANIQNISSPGIIYASGNIESGGWLKGDNLNVTGNANVGNLNASNIRGVFANGNSNISIPAANGNINFSAEGNANVVVITGTGLSVPGNANIGNIGVTGNITGSFGVNTSGNLNVSGNAVIGGNLTVNGNLTYVNVTDLSISDPIIQLQTGPNGAAPTSNSGKDVGTALNYYDTSAKIAWMGWDVSNAEIAFGSNVTIASEVVSFGNLANIRSGNAQLGNLATANFLAGTLTTAAQPNITSVGTLTSLAVSGNGTFGNISGAFANGNSNISIPAANGNVNISAAGNANVVVVTGTGANISGTVNATGNGTFANVVGGNLVSANFVAGVLTTAAQPNITSVGTLGSLATTGNVSVGGNLSVTAKSNLGANGNVIITGGSNGQILTTDGAGNLSWTTAAGGASISNGNSNVNIATANGNVTVSVTGNANILTVTGTGANVTGTFNTTGNLAVGGKSNLGPAGNVVITGGTNNQYLQTDGSGNLSWGTVSNLSAVSDTFTGNGVQTTFTLSTPPANINLTYVNYNGALLQRSSYSISGSNVVFSDPPANGSAIEVTTMAGSIGSGVAYSRTNYTATASQTVFSVNYVPGYIQVFYNGALLSPVDYTATNGTSVTLADAASVGDLVEFVSFTTAAPVVSQPATLNSTNLNSNLTIGSGYSAVSAGPITIANGVSVTIASGQKWVIL